MEHLVPIAVYLDGCLFIALYAHLWKVRKRVGFHLGMNISLATGGMAALLFGVLLINQYPFHFTYITILSALVGMAAGALFGRLFDYQTFVTGLTNGIVAGLMAPMIGTVVDMPLLFIGCLHILFVLCLCVIWISVIRS
ncbi:hypothetical protein [Bhargavaea cecembensis]|uniref:hypothetical protein n=1 Tax=Bhargavaea cecembensis TaxID=394098 RepID=UPI0006947719|nr:hypothetical protein [Bhargavaea cecembensis]